MAEPTLPSVGPKSPSLEDLQKRHKDLVSVVEECEVGYRDTGLGFHQLHLGALVELVDASELDGSDLNRLMQAFMVNSHGGDPEVVQLLIQYRNLRDDAKAAILRKDLVKADDLLMIAEDLMETVEDQLVSLEFLITHAKNMLSANHALSRYADESLPAAGDRHESLRAWLLCLPENLKTLELRISTEDEIVYDVLHSREDRITDPYVPWDSESDVPAPQPTTAEAQIGHFEADEFWMDPATREAIQPRSPRARAIETTSTRLA